MTKNRQRIAVLVLLMQFVLEFVDASFCANCDCTGTSNITCRIPSFQRLPTIKLPANATVLDLSGNNFLHFSIASLGVIKSLEEVNLEGNKIYALENGVFKGAEYLERINLEDNNIRCMGRDVFRDLKSVKEINLKKNNLTTFPNLQNNTALEIFSICYNKLHGIPSQAFQANVEMRELYLKSTGLRRLRRDAFSGEVLNMTVLDLSNNLLWNTPSVVREMRNLKKLHLSSNPIKIFSADDFLPLSSLETLTVSETGMEDFPKNLFWLPNLEHLDISQNSIRGNSLENIRFANLRTLDISHNPIGVIAYDSFEFLSKLEELDASFGDISGAHDRAFTSLQRLKRLNLSNNNLGMLPKLHMNRDLGEIFLDNNNIESFSWDSFIHAEYLKVLSISNNSLTTLADNSPPPTKLAITSLNLSGNDFTELPSLEVFKQLTSLKSLDLSRNEIGGEFRLSSVSGLPELEELNLEKNHISATVADSLEVFWNMKRLHLCENNLTKLDEMTLSSFTKLEKMTAGENFIEEIHNSTFSFNQYLQKISLDSNKLYMIDSGAFSFVPELKELMLRDNKLTDVPNLSKNKKLKVIGLSHNLIKNLNEGDLAGPEALETVLLRGTGINSLDRKIFGNVDSIKELDIALNGFSSMPEAIRDMAALRVLKLTGNPISHLSAHCFKGLSNLREIYLDRMRLSSIDMTEFATTLPGIRYVWLSQNPWQCDCKMESFALGVGEARSRVTTMDRSQMMCDGPPSLRDRMFDCLDLTHFRHCKMSKITEILDDSALLRLPLISGLKGDVFNKVTHMSLPGIEETLSIPKEKEEVWLTGLIPNTTYLVCVSTKNVNDKSGNEGTSSLQENCIKFNTKPFRSRWTKGGESGSEGRSQHALIIYAILAGTVILIVGIVLFAMVHWCKNRQIIIDDDPIDMDDSENPDALNEEDDDDFAVNNDIDMITDSEGTEQTNKESENGAAIQITNENELVGCDNKACDVKIKPQRTKL